MLICYVFIALKDQIHCYYKSDVQKVEIAQVRPLILYMHNELIIFVFGTISHNQLKWHLPHMTVIFTG